MCAWMTLQKFYYLFFFLRAGKLLVSANTCTVYQCVWKEIKWYSLLWKAQCLQLDIFNVRITQSLKVYLLTKDG